MPTKDRLIRILRTDLNALDYRFSTYTFRRPCIQSIGGGFNNKTCGSAGFLSSSKRDHRPGDVLQLPMWRWPVDRCLQTGCGERRNFPIGTVFINISLSFDRSIAVGAAGPIIVK